MSHHNLFSIFSVRRRERRSALESQHGDPFTLLAVFDEWIKVKAARHEPTRWETLDHHACSCASYIGIRRYHAACGVLCVHLYSCLALPFVQLATFGVRSSLCYIAQEVVQEARP